MVSMRHRQVYITTALTVSYDGDAALYCLRRSLWYRRIDRSFTNPRVSESIQYSPSILCRGLAAVDLDLESVYLS